MILQKKTLVNGHGAFWWGFSREFIFSSIMAAIPGILLFSGNYLNS
jgi:hypothetical protein